MIWQKPALKSMRAEGMSNIITTKSNEVEQVPWLALQISSTHLS